MKGTWIWWKNFKNRKEYSKICQLSRERHLSQKQNPIRYLFCKISYLKEDCCYLVEGYTDVISMHQSGVENVVASSGTALSVEQIKLISRYTKNIHILFDGDAAGIKASLEVSI